MALAVHGSVQVSSGQVRIDDGVSMSSTEGRGGATSGEGGSGEGGGPQEEDPRVGVRGQQGVDAESRVPFASGLVENRQLGSADGVFNWNVSAVRVITE